VSYSKANEPRQLGKRNRTRKRGQNCVWLEGMWMWMEMVAGPWVWGAGGWNASERQLCATSDAGNMAVIGHAAATVLC